MKILLVSLLIVFASCRHNTPPERKINQAADTVSADDSLQSQGKSDSKKALD